MTEKICYTYLFYFSVEDYDVKFAIDYDDENVNPYPNETVEFRASAASEGIPAANYSVVNTGDTDHSKALEFASVAAANDTYIRYYPVEAEGETRFTTLSFDVQLKQDNEFAFAIDVMGSEKAMYRSIFNGKNSFIAFRNPTTSPDLDYCILNDYTTSTDARLVSKFEKDKWYNIKVKFDKQNKKADVYFDNTLLGSYESENIGLIDRIVFYDYGVTNRADWDLKSGRRIWIDNLELKYFNEKDIESVRFNSNEEIYGPMSEKISPKSFTVTVKAAKDINRDEIADTIILKGANGDTINAQEYLYDAETKTITARFENLAPETEYILNVSGLKTASGTAISDYSAVFRTESVPDYGAEVLSGAKIVKNGNTAALSGQIKNQTRYTVSPVAILGEYCNEGLVQVVIQPLSINAWTEEYEIEGVFLNNVQDTSVVYGFIWNDIKNIKPFSGCERIE